MAENKLGEGKPNLGEGIVSSAVGSVDFIVSAKPVAKYLSGARCTLKVNGKIIGFAFAISWNIKTTVTEINTIDDYLPYELAPQRISVDGAISGFRIPGSGPTQNLIQADSVSFLHQRYIEIEVRDTQTDNLIFLANKAMIVGRNENIKSDALADISLNFKAIGWVDERLPRLPDGVGESVDVNGTSGATNLKNKVKNLFN